MKHLIEKRNSLLDTLDKLLEDAKDGNRELSDEEIAQFEELKKGIEQIDKTLKATSEAKDLEKTKQEEKEVDDDMQNPQEKRALQIKQDEEDFLYFLQNGRLKEGRAAGNMSLGQNGAVIPKTISDRIIDNVKNLSPILAKATIFNVKGDLVIPTYDYTQHSTGYLSEFPSITASTGQFGSVTLTNLIIGSLALVSKSMISRTDVDVLPFVINEISKSIANFLESELVAGQGGNGKLKGLAQVVPTQITTGATTMAITAQELINLQLKVPQAFQKDACWVMHPSTLGYIQGLTGGAGNNLLLMGNSLSQDAPYTLLGKPVCVSDNMPQMAANALEIFYGDLSGLYVKMTKELELSTLMERYADQYAVGVTAFMELDSIVGEQQKIVAYKGK